MNKRGIKRKAEDQPDSSEEGGSGVGWSNFQIATRRRESLRLKSQICATPGLVEKALKDKIQVEMSLIEGTAKFILACHNQTQSLEAGKTLLVARLRSDMMKFELNKIRRGRGSPPNNRGKPSYAGLSLSDIRIPLLWRRKEHLHETVDSRRFAVFVVARIGSQIYDTTLIEPVDRHVTDVSLPDVLLFSKVPPYFEITLEVYSHEMEKELGRGITATPQKIVRSISRAVGRTLTKSMKNFEDIGPKFELIASVTLTLDDCDEKIKSHELYVEESHRDLGEEETQNRHQLPLFGQICARLAALPYCCEEEVLSGILTMRRNGKLREMWSSLIDWKLCLWKDKSNKDAARMPDLEIPVTRNTQIQDSGDDILSIANKKIRWEFVFEDKENLHNWLIHLIQHAQDHRRWKQAAEQRMLVYSPQNVTVQRRPFKRTRSKLVMLYNDIDHS